MLLWFINVLLTLFNPFSACVTKSELFLFYICTDPKLILFNHFYTCLFLQEEEERRHQEMLAKRKAEEEREKARKLAEAARALELKKEQEREKEEREREREREQERQAAAEKLVFIFHALDWNESMTFRDTKHMFVSLQRKTRAREGCRSSEGTGESSQREREEGDGGEEEDGKEFVVLMTFLCNIQHATRCFDGWFFYFYRVERHWSKI